MGNFHHTIIGGAEAEMENKNMYRENITIGLVVDIVLKKDQGTARLTRGKVMRVLTNKSFHSRGIKVELQDGNIGRVQRIVSDTYQKRKISE